MDDQERESPLEPAEIDPALDSSLDQVSRRSFLERMGTSTVAAAVVGGESLTRNALAQGKTPEALNDKSLIHEHVKFTSQRHDVNGFLCRPRDGGKRGSIIVVHEIFGLNDHIRDIACRFAKAGYNGLAVDFFTREGNPPDVGGGFQPLMDFVNKIPDAQIMADANAAASFLRHRGDSNGKVGIVGFCWGGRISMLASASVAHLNAAVAYYGRIKSQATANQPHSALELAGRMNAPLMGHFGALDRGIPPADANALRDALARDHKTAEIYVYEGANHAFNNDTRESYHADSARLAWRRTLEWFGKYVK